jgi:predicted metal-dependent hydrolase
VENSTSEFNFCYIAPEVVPYLMPNSASSPISDVLPDEFWQGIHQFNQGDYYDCHDTLEALWMAADPIKKSFYQGILQIAVGFYHLRNQNWRGAAILLGEGSQRLEFYEPDYGGIDVTHLLDQSQTWLAALQETGPDGVEIVAAGLSQLTVPSPIHTVSLPKPPKIEGL